MSPNIRVTLASSFLAASSFLVFSCFQWLTKARIAGYLSFAKFAVGHGTLAAILQA